jgi:hypothetical protein
MVFWALVLLSCCCFQVKVRRDTRRFLEFIPPPSRSRAFFLDNIATIKMPLFSFRAELLLVRSYSAS